MWKNIDLKKVARMSKYRPTIWTSLYQNDYKVDLSQIHKKYT